MGFMARLRAQMPLPAAPHPDALNRIRRCAAIRRDWGEYAGIQRQIAETERLIADYDRVIAARDYRAAAVRALDERDLLIVLAEHRRKTGRRGRRCITNMTPDEMRA